MKKNMRNLLVIFILFLISAAGAACTGSERLQPEPEISLYLHETGKIKNIKIEKYLQGVVAGEIEPSWPLEALSAQAILARTYTMKMIEKGSLKDKNADASTDPEEFQAYEPQKINNRIIKAVERTRGKVVTNRGDLIDAWFHADAGGRTAAYVSEGIAPTEKTDVPYIKSTVDPGYRLSPPENKNWTARFPVSIVSKKIFETTGQDTGSIFSAQIEEKGPSGRAVKIKVGKAVIKGPELRSALGNDKIRSTLIKDIFVKNNYLVVKGSGYGHGVGMSQWGAYALAKQGKNAEQIINYFFDNVTIMQQWK